MDNDNIYSPPEANLGIETKKGSVLAGRWSRLGAAILDGLLVLAFLAPIFYFSDSWVSLLTDISMTPSQTAKVALLSLLAYWIPNAYWIAKDGQSIGKKLFRIRMVSIETEQIVS